MFHIGKTKTLLKQLEEIQVGRLDSCLLYSVGSSPSLASTYGPWVTRTFLVTFISSHALCDNLGLDFATAENLLEFWWFKKSLSRSCLVWHNSVTLTPGETEAGWMTSPAELQSEFKASRGNLALVSK